MGFPNLSGPRTCVHCGLSIKIGERMELVLADSGGLADAHERCNAEKYAPRAHCRSCGMNDCDCGKRDYREEAAKIRGFDVLVQALDDAEKTEHRLRKRLAEASRLLQEAAPAVAGYGTHESPEQWRAWAKWDDQASPEWAKDWLEAAVTYLKGDSSG